MIISFSWTTPVRPTRKKAPPSLPSTPLVNNKNSGDMTVARNLMGDLSLEENPRDIQDILVGGLSSLSVNDTHRLFPPIAAEEEFRTSTPTFVPPIGDGVSGGVTSSPIPPLIPAPITYKRTTSSETRLRYAKPPTNPKDSPLPQGEERGKIRKYCAFQMFRWLVLLFLVWFGYFGYICLNAEV